MPTSRLNGIDIHWERHGSGRRLLYISGTGGDLRAKPGVFDGPFADCFDLLAYDQRGLGQSSKPDIPYTMADYADDAAAVIEAAGWADAMVIGVSFGGMVAMELALRHPEKVTRLVLACTSPGGAGGASYPLHEIAHLDAEVRARLMIPITDTRMDEAWAAANPEALRQAVEMSLAAPFADEPGREVGARRQLQARAGHDAWERLDQIACPTLIAGGLHDGMALPETQRRMAGRIEGAELRMFDGGHMFMLQDPKAAPAIIEFLER